MPRIDQCKEALIYHSMQGDDYKIGMKNYATHLLEALESISFVLLKTEIAKSLEKNFTHLREKILN